jgi:hypothetical protein
MTLQLSSFLFRIFGTDFWTLITCQLIRWCWSCNNSSNSFSNNSNITNLLPKEHHTISNVILYKYFKSVLRRCLMKWKLQLLHYASLLLVTFILNQILRYLIFLNNSLNLHIKTLKVVIWTIMQLCFEENENEKNIRAVLLKHSFMHS